MRLISYNVNGLRAAFSKPGFADWLASSRADVLALQETKARPEQLPGALASPDGYGAFFSCPTAKKGYSGVAVYARERPLATTFELPWPEWAQEGRLIHLELKDFHFLNVYFPNGQRDSGRLDFKLGYYEAFLEFAQGLRASKPVVVCGDFNTAHREIDLARPDLYGDTSGFLPQERGFLSGLIGKGYLDTYRTLNGDLEGQYTWWSYRAGDRRRNNGWRIDYFFVSSELAGALSKAWIEPQVGFSDHCPIGLELDL